MSSFLKDIVTAHSGISSKRVCGVLGWITCLGLVIYCLIMDKLAPDIALVILYCCLGLLGVDSVTNIFKKN